MCRHLFDRPRMKKVEVCEGEDDLRLVLLREGLKVQGGWRDSVCVQDALDGM